MDGTDLTNWLLGAIAAIGGGVFMLLWEMRGSVASLTTDAVSTKEKQGKHETRLDKHDERLDDHERRIYTIERPRP